MMLPARFLVGFLVLVALMLASARDASACSCGPSGPPCQNAFQVDAVFAGTVTRVTPLPDDGPPLRPNEVRIPKTVRVEFSAVTGFRGLQSTRVSVFTAGSGPTCGYAFKEGESYLVYATRGPDGGLVTGICSRTRPLAEAADDLRFLGTLTGPGGTHARILGAVTHWERYPESGAPREHGPVQNVYLNVRGSAGAFDTLTNADGRYQVEVPPGKYEIQAVPPAGFSTRYLQRTVDLRDPRACVVADFFVRFDGRIRGIVQHHSGGAAAGVTVQAIAAANVGNTGNIDVFSTSTDAHGAFEFIELSPGRYVVGVDLIRRSEPDVMFPTTFHPGTPDARLATIVEVDGGQHRRLEPLTLPQPRRSFRLVGSVVFEDGRPAAGVYISLSDGASQWRQVGRGTQTASDGSFELVVHEGLSYIASAYMWDEATRTQIGGRVGPFVVGEQPGPLKVVLARR